MSLDVILLILRLLLVVLLYLFLMQVVLAITRDLRKPVPSLETVGPPVVGHLIVVDSGPSTILPGTSFALQPQTTIGRGPINTIQLPDNFISFENTRLWYRNGTWYVQDSNSTNGTFLNEQPAKQPLAAKPGDIIRVGFIRFQLKQ
jgi:pSer/pThr/pTyr-binding forkhead associated (FHA) protein